MSGKKLAGFFSWPLIGRRDFFLASDWLLLGYFFGGKHSFASKGPKGRDFILVLIMINGTAVCMCTINIIMHGHFHSQELKTQFSQSKKCICISHANKHWRRDRFLLIELYSANSRQRRHFLYKAARAS